MRSSPRMRSALLCLALVACDAAPVAHDAGSVPDDAALPGPAAPVLTPCPSGWREVVSDDLTECEPWPETGRRADCAADEAHFPGEPGCARVGSECTADGWPAEIAPRSRVVFVDDDAGAGGDGSSRASALTSVGAGLAMARRGDTVAVAGGRYVEEPLEVGEGVTLLGACARDTVVVARAEAPQSLVTLRDGASARDLTLADTLGPGVTVFGAGTSLTGVVIARAAVYGVGSYVGDVTLDSVVVRDLRAIPIPATGLFARGGAIVARRVVVADVEGNGVGVVDGGSASLERTLVRGTRAVGDSDGVAVGGLTGARLSLRAVVLEDNAAAAVLGADAAAVNMTDVVVTGASGADWQGVRVADLSGALTVERLRVRGTSGGALVVRGASTRATVSDVLIADTAPARSGFYGDAIWVDRGASLTLTRASIRRVHEAGLAVIEGASVVASDLFVSGVPSTVCPGAGCETIGGMGVVASSGATVSVTRFWIEEAALCGVVVGDAATPASLDLAHGVIDRVPVGACVQVPGYDAERLHDDVTYRDVETPLTATSYTLPSPPR